MAEERCTRPPEPAVATELRALVSRAQAGEAGALPRIRAILDEHPEVWQHVGNLSALAERAWVTVLAADHPLAVESMKRTVAEMKAELAGPHPTRLEQMLVDQVLVCWLECQYLASVSANPGRSSLDQAAFLVKRVESAQKRYLNAAKTLTTLRALLPSGLAPAQAVHVFQEPRRLPA
jgi:hypothetical protein